MILTPWSELKESYAQGGLLLGNGASIAVANSLHYNSLYDAAKDKGYLTPKVASIFKHFDTTDFEFVLRIISNAHVVNERLAIVEIETKQAYDLVKDSLIKTVRAVHPEHSCVCDDLEQIWKFMAHFRTVFSLNYDLLVYWAIMQAKSKVKANLLKDCFSDQGFDEDFEWLRRPQPPLETATLVFYPHGNLALVADIYGAVSKITAKQTDLVSEVAQSWSLGLTTPLFVSEGEHKDKLQAIRRNSYLNAAYGELSRLPESLVLYGWACAEQDQHILSAISRSEVKRVAVGVYTGDEDWKHNCYTIRHTLTKSLNIKESDIQFYDSSAEGIWLKS